MFGNYKIVVNTAAGRRRYMQYLIPQVLGCGIVDRYDLWINTNNTQDIEFFRQVSKEYPKINLIWQPDGIVNGNSTINAFYKECVDEETIYFKLDDDIVWLEENLIEKMVKFRIENSDFFLVTPLVINNALTTYLLQIHNKLKLSAYFGASASHEILWESGMFALELHNWFLQNVLIPQKWSNLYLGGASPMGMTRFSINAILWFGKDMKKFSGIVPGDDEEFLSCIYPTRCKLNNCWNGDAICAHFAFFTQREVLDKEGVLERYGTYLESKWERTKFETIYEYIKQCLEYVELHKNELPPSPYKQITPVVQPQSILVRLIHKIKLLISLPVIEKKNKCSYKKTPQEKYIL